MPVRRLRRLTNEELANVLADAVSKPVDVSALGDDPRVGGYTNNAAALLVSGTRFDELHALAARVAKEHAVQLAGCSTTEAKDVCARRFAGTFGRRLYGARVEPGELDALMASDGPYGVGVTTEGHEAGLRLIATSLILSPRSLYRSELGDQVINGRAALTLAEVASSISFALVGSRPDEELLASVDDGRLREADVRRRHIARLAGSARGRVRFRAFIIQWLGMDHADRVEKDLAVYPAWSSSVAAASKREVEAFLDHALAGAGTLDAVMTTAAAFPDAALATAIYGDDLRGQARSFEQVPVDARRRKGVLSLAGFLATHGQKRHSGPIERGLFVRENLLCLAIPQVPANLMITPIDHVEPGKTTREKFAQHSSDAACRSCHKMFDGLGFGLETMDGIGRHRVTEGGVTIDSRGELPPDADVQGTFTGPAELSDRLASSAAARACFTQHALRFTDGVEEQELDECEREAIATAFTTGERRIDRLWMAMADRDSTRLRRIEP